MSDLIDRQAAIDAIKKDMYADTDYMSALICEGIENVLNDLPSAQPEKCEDCGNFNKTMSLIPQPERKKGKWEEKEVIHEVEASTAIDEWQSARCSVCGKYHTTPYMYYFDEFNFCPNCGADMRGEQDEAD